MYVAVRNEMVLVGNEALANRSAKTIYRHYYLIFQFSFHQILLLRSEQYSDVIDLVISPSSLCQG